MKEAGDLRVREIQGDVWSERRAIVPRGEPLALGELGEPEWLKAHRGSEYAPREQSEILGPQGALFDGASAGA